MAEANITLSLGLVALHRNDYPWAGRKFVDGYHFAPTAFEETGAVELLLGLAAVAAGERQPERAAKLSGAAQASMGAVNDQMPHFDRAEFERHIRIAREQIGEAAFAALAAEGRVMTVKEAVAYALDPVRSSP
jgi:hypothetical protein